MGLFYGGGCNVGGCLVVQVGVCVIVVAGGGCCICGGGGGGIIGYLDDGEDDDQHSDILALNHTNSTFCDIST